MYRQFNIHQLYALPTHCIYVFCVDLRTNRDLCHLHHKLVCFYNRYLNIYSPVVTICTTSLTFTNCTLWPHYIYEFCIYLRTNSDLCHLQDKLIGFYNRDLTLYSPVVTICTASLTFNNSTFCPHTVIMCFLWIWEQTAIIFLYSINWLVFITEI